MKYIPIKQDASSPPFASSTNEEIFKKARDHYFSVNIFSFFFLFGVVKELDKHKKKEGWGPVLNLYKYQSFSQLQHFSTKFTLLHFLKNRPTSDLITLGHQIDEPLTN